MSQKKHVILCNGGELTLADIQGIQELLQETHGFAKYHYEKNRSAKYLTIETKFHSDSRDFAIYNIEHAITANSGSIGRQLYVQAPDDGSMFSARTSWIEQCKSEGWTYEIYDGTVRDAIYDHFPECELKEDYRYCSAFLARWCQYISGEATSPRVPESTTLLYIADQFPSVPLDAEMYAIVGNTQQRHAASSLSHQEKMAAKGREVSEATLDTIPNIISGNKDADGYMIVEIHKRDDGMVFRGKIKSEYQFALILDSVGVRYDW